MAKPTMFRLQEHCRLMRTTIRQHHTMIRRCRHGYWIAGATPVIASAAASLADPIAGAVTAVLTLALAAIAVRGLRTTIRNHSLWLRNDRSSLHDAMNRIRTKRRNLEIEAAAKAAKLERERIRLEVEREAAERRREIEASKRHRACGGKVRHATHESAELHMRELSAKGGKGLNVYRCRYCEHFHVGHKMLATSGLTHRPFKKLAQ